MNGPTISDLAILRTAIAHSDIYVPAPAGSARALPPGFDGADLAILEWIVAEARRAGRRLTLA